MRYRPLGRTGLRISPLCLGAMMLGPWGNDDREDAARIIGRALDAGINIIDTSDSYSAGESERIVGAALKGRRDDVILATKFFFPQSDGPNDRGASRHWIMREVENSLTRLRTDRIDLYQLHRPSPETDIEETLGALTDLVRQGKVRYIGSSSFSGSQIVEAQWASRERNLARFVTEQPPQLGVHIRAEQQAGKPVSSLIGALHGELQPLAAESLVPLDDVLETLARVGAPERTVFHCFSGDEAMARTAADAGY